MRIGLIAGAVGLVVGLPALANGSPKTDIREYEADGRPVTPEFPFRDSKAGRQLGGFIGVSSSFGAVNRNTLGGDERQAQITLSDTFDVANNGYAPGSGASTVATGTSGLPVLPAGVNVAGTLSLSSTWSGTGAPANNGNTRSVISAAQVPPFAGVTNETIGGNSTFKFRNFTNAAQVNFFGAGIRYNYVKQNSGGGTGALTNIGQRFVFAPTSANNTRQIHDTYVTALTTLFTSESIYVSSGFIIDRLLWGGSNTTTGIGLPIGPIPTFYSLGPNPAAFLTGIFVPCTVNAIPVSQGGVLVAVPVNQWFRIIHESDPNFRVIIRYDPTMGGPGSEVKIYDNVGINVGRVDRLSQNCGFETLNDACYIDNLVQTGVEFVLPTPPALDCNAGNYTDNLNWLNTGPLFGQSTRWVDALSSKSTVQTPNVVFPNQSIRQLNQFPNDLTREEFRTTLPTTYATAAPWNLCVDVLIVSNNAPFQNVTAHNLGVQSLADGDDTTRMFIGFFDGVNPYISRIAIQTLSTFNPIDDEASTTPFAPGPNGNGGNYTLGTNAVDTGVSWPTVTPGNNVNDKRTVCFQVDSNKNLVVRLNGTTIHTGTAFVNSVDRLAFENKNNTAGQNNRWDVSNIVLTCQTLPLVVLPPLTLVYNDNLEWANLNITIGANRETTNPTEIFRWGSAAQSPVVQGFATNSTKVLQISNILRDFAPVVPTDPTYNTNLGTDARTFLPQVVASATRGWVAKADLALTDDLSSRNFQMAESTPAGGTNFYLVTDLAFSSVTKTFWVRTPILPLPAAAPFTSYSNTTASLSTLGLSLGQWFNLSTHRNLNGTYTYRFNGRLLRDGSGNPVIGQQIQLRDGANVVSPKNMNAWFTASPDDNTAPANGSSRLYVDNIRAWALPCLGDTNNDGVVNFLDLNNVLGFFGQTGANQDITGNCAPDPSGQGFPTDNLVNFTDLNAVLSGFGVPCT